MPKRYVTKHPMGWALKAPSSERASSVHSTQHEADQAAKQTVRNLGGGEVRIQGRDGRWRDSDTVPPGNDPNPPRDKKHWDWIRIDHSRSRSRQLQSDVSGAAEESLKANWPLVRHSHIRADRPVV
jgi:hypothetical protein